MPKETGGLERIEGAHGEAVKYMRDDMRDLYDHELKNTGYLLAAHAAGLIGCLSTLKDYTTTPQLKGMGLFIVMFALGFLSAALATVSLSIGRSEMLTWITHGGDRPKMKSLVPVVFQFLSLVALILAIVMIVYRFYGL